MAYEVIMKPIGMLGEGPSHHNKVVTYAIYSWRWPRK